MTTDALIIKGDCLNVMTGLPEASVDAIVTDPPYGLSFMGKDWDKGVPGESFWREALRVAKPGTHLLAFGGTRTYHRLACAIEDAGWEIRDCVMWVYGSGFPKSHDVSKAIDKAAGAEREVTGTAYRPEGRAFAEGASGFAKGEVKLRDKAATDAAKQWQGWGTALKPAWEPIIVARKPLAGTVAENVLKHGTGALNIDGCRIGRVAGGRWPANLIHDGSDEVVGLFPQTAGNHGGRVATSKFEFGAGDGSKISATNAKQDFGSAARFFYSAKASKSDRDADNNHPTVKPVDLMKYLCRLITPPGGLILDPFCGSGSTGVASMREGFNFIGIELNADYAEIARRRIDCQLNKTPLFSSVI